MRHLIDFTATVLILTLLWTTIFFMKQSEDATYLAERAIVLGERCVAILTEEPVEHAIKGN